MNTTTLPERVFIRCIGYYSYWPDLGRYKIEDRHSWATLAPERVRELLASGEAKVVKS